jgi:hypothetical protein
MPSNKFFATSLGTQEAATINQIIKTVAATTTPELIVATPTFFSTAIIIACKAAQTPNTGDIYLGLSAGDATQSIKVVSGASLTLTAPVGQKLDLSKFYVDVGTAADGVVVVYW